MKYIIIHLFISLITMTSLIGQRLQLNLDRSGINWYGKAAFSAYTLSGTIAPKSAVLEKRGNGIVQGQITIDMLSLEAENIDLQQHLKSKDFFEVDQYQEAQFIFQQHTPIDCELHELSGSLTIKNIEQPIVIPIKISINENGLRVEGRVTIDRTLFGIQFNSPNYFKNLKDQAIADKFELSFDLHFQVE